MSLVKSCCGIIVVAIALLAARPALADDKPDDEDLHPVLSHSHQFGLHVQPGVGYRVLFPYDSGTQYCGQMGKSVCTGRSPTFLDLGISYAVSPSVELVGDARLGLEDDFSGPAGGSAPKPNSFAIGARFYLEPSGTVKFFSAVELAIDTTDYAKTAGVSSGADYGLRNTNGILFDIMKNVGVYLAFGETITFKTWLRFELDAGVGVQVRFP